MWYNKVLSIQAHRRQKQARGKCASGKWSKPTFLYVSMTYIVCLCGRDLTQQDRYKNTSNNIKGTQRCGK